MGKIEEKITSTILTAIRARKEVSSVLDNRSQLHPTSVPAKLREALFSDFEAVAELKHRWGLAQDSLANWERLWRQNPALAKYGLQRPIGWVLEAEGKVVGYLGNISLLYRFGGRTLTAVTAHGFVVESAYRAVGVSLVAAFFRQRSVDLFICTSAIESVGRIARAFRCDPIPQTDCDTVCFWVLRAPPFAKALLTKLEVKALLSRAGGSFASLAISADRILHRRWPRKTRADLSVTEIRVSEIGYEFQDLWVEIVKERPELFADRTPETLRWHFEIPGDRGTTHVLRCLKSGELVGYAVVRDEVPEEISGLRKSIIADMLAKRNDPHVIEALIVAAYDHARKAGSHILELMGFPQSTRLVCRKWHPYLRKYASSPFFYKATNPLLHKQLSDAMQWYATPFDGDATLIRPSYSCCV